MTIDQNIGEVAKAASALDQAKQPRSRHPSEVLSLKQIPDDKTVAFLQPLTNWLCATGIGVFRNKCAQTTAVHKGLIPCETTNLVGTTPGHRRQPKANIIASLRRDKLPVWATRLPDNQHRYKSQFENRNAGKAIGNTLSELDGSETKPSITWSQASSINEQQFLLRQEALSGVSAYVVEIQRSVTTLCPAFLTRYPERMRSLCKQEGSPHGRPQHGRFGVIMGLLTWPGLGRVDDRNASRFPWGTFTYRK